jgi:hypothetical protein
VTKSALLALMAVVMFGRGGVSASEDENDG